MNREIRETEDGSKTLYISNLDENYHSFHGALQEANHVFIKNGFILIYDCEINILELGFGTGLNVLVTINEFLKSDKSHKVNYYTLEKYPITSTEVAELGYEKLFEDPQMKNIYHKIHETPWESLAEIVPNFNLKKIKCDFFDLAKIDLPKINLVYYDCFGAKVQPDLWEKPLFEIVAEKMEKGSLLTTYSSKGSVKRILKELGFTVEKKQGPPGKREMINAFKIENN